MSYTFTKHPLLIALFLVGALCARGQDLHFSQFDFSPLNMNPALTGIFKGDMRFTGNVRSQWVTVPVSYLTASAGYDFKLYDKNLQNTLFAGGVLFNYDRAGDGNLSLAQLGLSTSVTQQLSDQNFLTLGVQFNVHQRSLRPADLTFGNQFDGEQFNPNLSSREDFETTVDNYFGIAIGLNWHYQVPESRTRIDAGFGMFNFNQPEVSFLGDASSLLNNRLAYHAKASFLVSKDIDLVAKFLGQSQGKYQEMVAGAGVLIHLNQAVGRELALQLGGGYRFDDALFPEAHLFIGPWTFGLSYDVNSSDFSVATNRAGGVELSVMYIFTKVRPVPLKICPIF